MLDLLQEHGIRLIGITGRRLEGRWKIVATYAVDHHENPAEVKIEHDESAGHSLDYAFAQLAVTPINNHR